MIRWQPTCAALALLMLPAWAWAAENQGSQAGTQAPQNNVFADIRARTSGEPVLLAEAERYSEWALRFGWWGFWHTGSPQKVGEYQDLSPSPFWDADGFSSDGTRTVAVTATGMDNETTYGKLYFFQDNVTATLDYERFLHRRDHDPLANMLNPDQSIPLSPNPPNPKVIKEDISVGQDYAFRVQEFNTSVKWIATDNFRARVDVWGLEKEGYRQANAVGMCYTYTSLTSTLSAMPDGHPLTAFPGAKCHLLSQAQHVDWMTTEVKPVFEVRLGDSFTVEYSRPMRGFTADDQTVGRYYDHRSFELEGGTFPVNSPDNFVFAKYGVVPNNHTEMDQVKISGQLTENTRAYAFLMAGNTVQEEIDMHRWFNNADMRLTNTSIDNVTLTGYARVFNESESPPDAAKVLALVTSDRTILGPPGVAPPFPTLAQIQDVLDMPIGYHQSTGGVKGVWRVRGNGFDRGGLAIIGGYEYGDLERTNAVFTAGDPAFAILDESRTITHCFQIGPDYRWSNALDMYARYKFQLADQPLIGFKGDNGVFNTLLPRHDHIVEFGFNWVPAQWFIMNACVGIETADNHSSPATLAADPSLSTINFNEQNFPATVSLWYAVSPRWSLSAGYALFSNFVAQDIVIGDDPPPYSIPPAAASIKPVVAPWRYGGRAQVVTFGSRYAASENVALTGAFEWVRGHDLITNSTTVFPTSGNTITDLGLYSQTLNETTRLTVGADWRIRPRVVSYVRYELYNFNDMFPGYQTGLAQGVLGGLSALF